jgi:hypothetical protein
MIDDQDIPQSLPDAAEPAPAPPPSEAPSGGTGKLHWTNADAEVEYAKHFAKDEDISNYRDFRKDIDDYEAGVEFSDDRRRDFQHKIKQATAEAAAAADGLEPPPDLGPGYISREEAAQAIEQATSFAKAQARFEAAFPDAEYRNMMGETISLYQPEQAIIDHLTESQFGPQIAERLYQNPEAISELNKLPPAEMRRLLSRLEGVIMAEQNFAAQTGQAVQPRRVSKAPPPFRSPSGGASPPSDAFQLAQRGEDVSDYVRFRRQQEKRSRD